MVPRNVSLDGTEIHAARGYLIGQFFHDTSNKKIDQGRGSIERRASFSVEVVRKVVSAEDEE